MKAGLFAFAMLLMTAGAANAGGLVTKHSASVQLNVDAARATHHEDRKFVQYLSGVKYVDTTDGSTAGTVSMNFPPQVFMHLAQLLLPKILLEQHLVSVNLTHR